MKKLVILLMMVFVASGVNGQSTVEDLFERLENIEEKKRINEEEEKRKKEEKEILLEQKEKCKIFATKLRFEGVDVTKLTDEDIDRLDSLRQQHDSNDLYERLHRSNSLYALPSVVFKDVMKQERKYYARIFKKDARMNWYTDTIYCAADSIVFVEPGIYQYITVKDSGVGFEWLRKESCYLIREGNKLTIGRATFICRETKEESIKKTKKRKHYDDVYE